MFKCGLIVGKFCPLHKGHVHLISEALAQCEQLYILSYTNPGFPGCEPEKRLAWLNAVAPEAKTLVLGHNAGIPSNASSDDIQRAFTGRICQEEWDMCPDAVFTSEVYGNGFAKHLSNEFIQDVAHICIDPSRGQVPISGTKIRQNVHKSRQFLPPHVYADFVETVCFLGAESTGKSSLSKWLSQVYSTTHVEEFGRTLWIEKDGKLVFDDYMKIALTHTAMEDTARLTAHRYVFIDTSPLTTLFYGLDQFGRADERLENLANRPYDHVFLCHPDFPMVQDGWRSDEDFRHRQHDWYVKTLNERGVDYTDLTGSFDNKVEQVKAKLTPPPLA